MIAKSKVSVSNKLRSTLQVIGALILMACGGANPLSCDDPPSPVFQGIEFQQNGTASFLPVQTHGETFQVPVTARTLTSGEVGTQSVITPDPIEGVTFSPASATVTMPGLLNTTSFTFEATIADDAPSGTPNLRFSRSGPPEESARLQTSTSLAIVPNLVAVTMTPSLSVRQGHSNSLTVSMLPRGNTEGPISFSVSQTTSFTISPSQFTANFIRNSSTPIVQMINVTVGPNVQVGTYYLLHLTQGSREVGSCGITVTADTGEPTFEIIATPATVTGANHTMTPEVVFTVRSLNGFSNNVKVTWLTDGSVSPSPSTNDFVLAISPTQPRTFNRRFYRYSEGTENEYITFNVTDLSLSIQKSVTITVRHP